MIKVTENIWRGPRPLSLSVLRRNAFTRVFNLQSGAEDFLTNSPYENEDPFEYGIHRINYHWSNVFSPDKGEIKEFLDALGSTGQKTYVHCHSGVDRTGFAIAVYRMQKMNWKFADAYKEWVELGRHWWFDWWKYELKKYELKK